MFPYRSILVVGGGTAGWMAAAYLQKVLCANKDFPVKITLVESKQVGIIGVGEATTPTLRATMALLDIPETALFKYAEASLKNGIRFHGFKHGGDAASDRYDHPFDNPITADGYTAMAHWMNLKQRGLIDTPFGDSAVVQTALFDAMRSPKLMASKNYDAPLSYGYHLDAVKLGMLLRDTAVARGVQHVIGDVVQAHCGEQGIESVELANGARLSADLFVDCSGFQSLLIGKALAVPFVSYADTLLCDRAVACQVAHASDKPELRSYTTATAKGAGWTWDIDLPSRRGTGYVYASAFSSADEAASTLLAHNGAGKDASLKHLSMRVGHQARMWEKNCLAIGLSAGFIEPMESTGIYLIEHALQLFIDYLPASGTAEQSRKRFNTLMSETYDELRDYIVLHYVLSRRRDTPFWRAYTEDVKISDWLADNLALWDEKLPINMDVNRRLTLFGSADWFYITAGMDRLPSQGIGQSAYIDPKNSQKLMDMIGQIRVAACAQSPSMRDYIQKIRGATDNVPFAARPGL